MSALRARGYGIIDVPLGLLPTRLRYEVPELVILDADAHEAAERVREYRAIAPASLTVLLGSRDGALDADPELLKLAELSFRRPLDIPEIAEKIAQLLGPAPRAQQLRPQARSRAPLLVASARRPYRSDTSPSSSTRPEAPLLDALESPWPVTMGPGQGPQPLPKAPGSVPPSRPPSISSHPPSDNPLNLSAETRALLAHQRRRVDEQTVPSSRPVRPAGAGELNRHVSRELLDALAEPLFSVEAMLPGRPSEETTSGGHRPSRGSEIPDPSSQLPPEVFEADLTNPGGRASHSDNPRTLGPEGRTRDPSVPVRDPMSGSLPPLEDLSDLLPPEVVAMGLLEGENRAGNPDDDAEPSTARGGKRDPLLAQSEQPIPTETGRSHPSGAPLKLDLTTPARYSSATPQNLPLKARSSALFTLARAIGDRLSGSLASESQAGIRRLVLRDGDLLTITSSLDAEGLVAFLENRGDLSPDRARGLGLVPRFGRHAGAALIAQGVLRQEDLWPILRAHAEWILGVILLDESSLVLEVNPPARIFEEPAVFGGSAGAEIFLDTIRRVIHPEDALARLGGALVSIGLGKHVGLFAETALGASREAEIHGALGEKLGSLMDRKPALLPILFGLTALGVLTRGNDEEEVRPAMVPATPSQEIDADAFLDRLESRLRWVEDGDYFSILGVARSATAYEVGRALGEVKREFAPEHLPAKHSDRLPDLSLYLRHAEEAHWVLSDDVRRERYRRALES